MREKWFFSERPSNSATHFTYLPPPPVVDRQLFRLWPVPVPEDGGVGDAADHVYKAGGQGLARGERGNLRAHACSKSTTAPCTGTLRRSPSHQPPFEYVQSKALPGQEEEKEDVQRRQVDEGVRCVALGRGWPDVSNPEEKQRSRTNHASKLDSAMQSQARQKVNV